MVLCISGRSWINLDIFKGLKMKQKYITLKINNANHGQLLTLAGELRIMARAWLKFGPRIEVLAGKLREFKQYQKNKK